MILGRVIASRGARRIERAPFWRACSQAQAASSGRWTTMGSKQQQADGNRGHWGLVCAAVFFVSGKQDTTSCQEVQEQKQQFQVKQVYDIEKVLGEGAFGQVFLARRKKDGQLLALKSMSRENTDKEEMDREVGALKRLSLNGGHPHVCRLFETHDDGKRYYYLALELVEGEELLEHLIRNGAYSEAQAARFLRQFAEAMSHIHAAGLTHADIKPENLMLSSRDDNPKLKVVDFGCSVANDEKDILFHEVYQALGTDAYWAPELFKGTRPTPAADMWATGCILYILVTGSHPFDKLGTATDEEVGKVIQQTSKSGGDRFLHDNVFDERVDGLSDSCINLMKQLLQPDPEKRMTSEEFLKHPWVQGLTASVTTLLESDRKLENFWQKEFRKGILKEYANATSDKGSLSKDNLRHIFDTIDLNGDGVLSQSEVRAALKRLGFQDDHISQIIASLDLDGSGLIEWDEFRSIMRENFVDGPSVRIHHMQRRFRSEILKKFTESTDTLSEEQLRHVYEKLDLDGNGVLDDLEIRVFLRSVGVVDEESIGTILASIDLDKSGGVSWSEFKVIMQRRLSPTD